MHLKVPTNVELEENTKEPEDPEAMEPGLLREDAEKATEELTKQQV